MQWGQVSILCVSQAEKAKRVGGQFALTLLAPFEEAPQFFIGPSQV